MEGCERMTTRVFDAASYIETPDDVAAYLNVILEEEGPSALVEAIGTVARSEGMTRIAELTGLKREGLYRSLGVGGNPSFATICKVLEACGLRLEVVRAV